ncbi:MAG: hypothetical protein M0P74_12450 [Syntrophales bacterium]|jgi:hypothetical protein|nr:hypothetical protein [Syntrophales bacterium]
MDFKKGDRVRYEKVTAWGLGEIIELTGGPYCKIFFVNHGERTIGKDFMAFLTKIEGKDAAHPLLDNLRLPGQSKDVKFRSIGNLVSLFSRIFPKGFYDNEYLKHERAYKVEAHNLMTNLLNQSAFADLMELGEYEEICLHALKVVNKTNLIFKNEKMTLTDGLKSAENRQLFSIALFGLLYGSEQLSKRFECFATALENINAAKWTTQTYFLFLAFPEKYMFMKPSVTQYAADAFAFELHYRSEINWNSYERLLLFSQYVSDELSKISDYLKPRDMIDTQSFIWSSVPGKYTA